MMGQIKNPLAKTGIYTPQTHFQSSAEMLSSISRSQSNTQHLQSIQKRKTNSQSRGK